MRRIALVVTVAVVALLIRLLMHGLLTSGCEANSATRLDFGLWVALSGLCGIAVWAGADAASRRGYRSQSQGVPRARPLYGPRSM